MTEAAGEDGRAAAITARNGIEDALFGLADIPLEFDRRAVRDRLLRAIQYLYAVLDNPVIALVHLEGLTESARAVAESRALLERVTAPAAALPLGRAIERLAAAEAALRSGAETVARVQLARRLELVAGTSGEGLPPARPFRASIGVPSLHALERLVILPHVIVDPAEPPPEAPDPPRALPRPETFEALVALAEEAASGALERRLMGDEAVAPEVVHALLPLAYAPAVEEAETLRRIGRDFLENIANHRNLRQPNAIEGWPDQGPFEQRILDNLDAFASLGGTALPLVSLFHAEAKAPDPERAFAAALTLGCIDGSDTIGAAVMTLKQSAPEEHPGWIEGLWLAPNPAIDRAMADLCAGRRDDLAALALDVLARRGSTPDDVVRALLGRGAPVIQRRVAWALAASLPREEAIEALLAMASTEAPVEVFTAAVESLLRRGHEGAVTLLRRVADGHLGRERARPALELLGLVGRPSDLDRLLGAATADPWPDLVRRLGRFGHAEVLPRLVELLAHEDPEIVAAAAESLERITGAGLREAVEEPWEVDLPPEIAEAGSIPMPMRKGERVSADPDRWSTWLTQNARCFDRRLKCRAGVPFTPLQILAELEAPATPPEAREEAALELALVTGLRFQFSPHDWVARQRRHLTELRSRVAAVRVTPGAWSFGLTTELDRPGERPSSRPPGVALPEGDLPFRSGIPALRAPEVAPTVGEVWEVTPPPSTVDPDSMAAVRRVLPFVRAERTEPQTPEVGTQTGQDGGETLPPPPVVPAAPLPFISRAPDLSLEARVPDQGPEQRSASGASEVTRPARPPAGGHGARPSPPPPPAQPNPCGPPPVAGPPEVRSLAQYASLCAELAVSPKSAEAIFRRYGLDTREKQSAVDAIWKERLRLDPVEYGVWREMYLRYHAYWTKQGTPPAG